MVSFIQDKSNIGKIILSKLQEKRKTMKQLSQETGVSYGKIIKLVDGTVKNPSMKVIVEIARCLDIPFEDLVKSILEDD